MATTDLGSTSGEIEGSTSEISKKLSKPMRRKTPSVTDLEPPTASNDCKDSVVIESIGDPKPYLFIHAQRRECCIYRVHNRLRNTRPEAYTPQMVSIGPFHSGNEILQPMEKCKQRYLAEFCKRTGKTWLDLLAKIKSNEEKIRYYYEEAFLGYEDNFDCYDSDGYDEESFPSNSFVNIILLDSVFIIEFLLRCCEYYENNYWQPKLDPIIGKLSSMRTIFMDLILLENQVPYFVLQDLYNFAIANTTTEDYPSFFSLACILLSEFAFPPKIERMENRKYSCNCFSCLYCFWMSRVAGFFQNPQRQPQEEESEEEHHQYFERIESEEHKHFTDMVRRLRSYNQTERKNNNGAARVLYSATMLHEAGVNFEASAKEWPLGVKFRKGILTMPRFDLHNETEQLVRNLMALEHYHYPYERFICSYICLLDDLVDTRSDVDLLVQNGIITHGLGDNEAVAKTLNNLGKEITYGNCYSVIAEELNKHHGNCWYRTVTNLRQVYFGNLWKGTGTIAAIVLLVLTFVQTYKAF